MNKKILNLAIPNILSNISIPLLSMVDTIVVGHLDEVYFLGAIAVGSMIFNFLYSGLYFLRMGTTGLTAQAYGRKDNHDIAAVLTRSVATALLLALVILLFQYPIEKMAVWLVDSTPDVEQYAISYFNIRIWAAPATLSIFGLTGWFLGMQNSRFPLYMAIFGNIFNLALNLFFIKVMGMKSDGVALGTLIAQYSTLIFGIILLFKKYPKYTVLISTSYLKNFGKLKEFFKINFNILVRSLALIFVINFFIIESAGFGETTLAANTILMQFWTLLAYGVDGFAFAAESLTGRFVGSKDEKSLTKVVRLAFYWGYSIAVTCSVIFYVFRDTLLEIFTNKPEVITVCTEYFFWIVLAPIINTAGFIWDGIYVGATATTAMRNAMLISVLLFFLPMYFLTIDTMENNGLWLAILTFMFARGLTLTLYFYKSILVKTKESFVG